MKKTSSHKLGMLGEEIAEKYLQKKKFKIAEKRFRLYRGEIDLIGYDKSTLVFIEVKTRNPAALGLPEESVNVRKQGQIKKIAEGYLALKGIDDVECRFDVISIIFDEDGGYALTHYEDAF